MLAHRCTSQRIWFTRFKQGPHAHRPLRFVWKNNFDPWAALNFREAQLVIQELICVSVCSFTFKFHSGDEIQEYITFFEKKTHSSSTLPIPAGSDSFFPWHSQRWLPMYLQEESKRVRVLKA